MSEGGLLEGKANSEPTLRRIVHTGHHRSAVRDPDILTDQHDRTMRVGGDLEAD
jgi:hypothetical protein